nr:alanine:cation symporter family protein [Campylobacter rectus]
MLTDLVSSINSFLWGPYFLIALLCGTGLYFTIRLRFVQIFKFKMGLHRLFGNFSLHGKAAGKSGMSSFQAVATAVAAQVGTGNLVGATTALIMGGPGAIFWMWCAAFLGMATNFAEICLAQIYRTKDDSGHMIGGPAFYISRGLKSRYAKVLAAFLRWRSSWRLDLWEIWCKPTPSRTALGARLAYRSGRADCF